MWAVSTLVHCHDRQVSELPKRVCCTFVGRLLRLVVFKLPTLDSLLEISYLLRHVIWCLVDIKLHAMSRLLIHSWSLDGLGPLIPNNSFANSIGNPIGNP